jgi:hypothetical protein
MRVLLRSTCLAGQKDILGPDVTVQVHEPAVRRVTVRRGHRGSGPGAPGRVMRMPRTLQELLAEAGEGPLIHTAHMNVCKPSDGCALRSGINGVESRSRFPFFKFIKDFSVRMPRILGSYCIKPMSVRLFTLPIRMKALRC